MDIIFSLIESVPTPDRVDVETPFESLPEKVRHVILYGSDEEEIAFSYTMESGNSAGKPSGKKHPFEGVLPNMMRALARYRIANGA